MKRPALHPTTAVLLLLLGLVLPGATSAQPPQTPPPPSGAGGGLGQDGQIEVVLEGEAQLRYPLAFPAASHDPRMSTAAVEAASELESALRADLESTEIFDIQGPWALAVLELTGDPGKDLLQYRSLGNEFLLLTELSEGAGQLDFKGRLIDLKNGESILGKRYRAEYATARTVAHTFADEIVRYLTGRPGIALTTIAFASDRTGNKEIYLMDYDGHNQRQISNHKSISTSPSWRLDGKKIAYLSYFDGPPGIYSVDVQTGRKQPLIVDAHHNFVASYSPDGRRVVFSRSLDGNTELFVATVGSEGMTRLTNVRAIDTNPAWSPKGDVIAFTSSRAGNPHIYLMDTEGSNVRRLTFDGEYNDGAAWNAEGTRIVYASRRDGTFQIATTEVATGETVTLTAGPGNKEKPYYSPDGHKIVFSHRLRGATQIYTMDADGSDVRQLTSEGNNASPSWSPYPEKYR